MSSRHMPRISVITPSYNQAQFLERTILSVLHQAYPNLQYGIVDGGSTDGSIEIINKYRNQIDFAIIEKDRGQADALNKGMKRANGEIVCYINSDDTLLHNALNTVGKHFKDRPEDLWIIGDCLYIDEQGKVMIYPETNTHRMVATDIDGLAHVLIRNKPVEMPQPGIFWKRSLLDRFGYFDETFHYTFDYDMWCRFLAAGLRPTIIHADLATYRIHDTSKTCAQRPQFLNEHIKTEKRYAKYLHGKQRFLLAKAIGYRRRQYITLTAQRRPWKQIITHPWWLASQQILDLLINGPKNNTINTTRTRETTIPLNNPNISRNAA